MDSNQNEKVGGFHGCISKQLTNSEAL